MIGRPESTKAPSIDPAVVRSWMLVLGITLAALALRCYRLDYQSLWGDELFSVVVARQEWTHVVNRLVQDFVHPPLHYFALVGVFGLAGVGSFEGRLLSAIFGTASVPMIFLAGRRLFGVRTGVIAAALLATSQLAVMYSQELRPYAQQMFLVCTALWLFAVAARDRQIWAWCGFVVVATLSLYTHYYSVFFIAPLFLWALVDRRGVPISWVVGGGVAVVALLLPWLANGVVEAALASGKTAPSGQPSWFAVNWHTPFHTLNQFNNGTTLGLLNDAPRTAYFAGAALFTTPALAALSLIRPAKRTSLRSASTWVVFSVAIAIYSILSAGGKAGLALATIVMLRALQLAASERLSRHSLLRHMASDVVWAGLLFFTIALAGMRYFPCWVVFVLGGLTGALAYFHLMGTGPPEHMRDGDLPYSRAQVIVGSAFLFPLVIPFALAAFNVQYDVRYTLSALPVYLLLVASGLARIPDTIWRRLVVALAIAYGLMSLRANYFVPYKENWRDAMGTLADRYSDGDCVVIAPQPDSGRLPEYWSVYGYDRRHPGVEIIPLDRLPIEAPACGRLWMFTYQRTAKFIASAEAIETYIRDTHRESDRRDFFWMGLRLYEPWP